VLSKRAKIKRCNEERGSTSPQKRPRRKLKTVS
jgi:hypothetical protein